MYRGYLILTTGQELKQAHENENKLILSFENLQTNMQKICKEICKMTMSKFRNNLCLKVN